MRDRIFGSRTGMHVLEGLPLRVVLQIFLFRGNSCCSMPQILSAASVYDYDLTTIDAQRIHLRDFKGKVVMIVNVASRCGYTPQYAGLQSLYLAHKDQGFVMIGIPPMTSEKENPAQIQRSSSSVDANTMSRSRSCRRYSSALTRAFRFTNT